jgi:hypothetical protein
MQNSGLLLDNRDIIALKQELHLTRHDTPTDTFRRLFLEDKIEKFQLPGSVGVLVSYMYRIKVNIAVFEKTQGHERYEINWQKGRTHRPCT